MGADTFLNQKRFYDIAAVVVIGLLVIAKLPCLNIPYFWDELGVYAPGALHMKDAGSIGIMPADLDPLYSRGHPLLFYFFAAGFYNLFGDSIAVGHAFAISVAAATLLFFYLFARKVFNARIALLAVVLLAVQPVFFSMAGIVLPEMMFTFFVIAGIWGIIEQKWWLYILGGSLAVLVKEPGLIVPGTCLLILFIESLRNKDFFTISRWKLFLPGAIPVVIYCSFLIIQKQQNGWYFFPYHMELMKFTADSIYYNTKHFLTELLLDQGRWLILAPTVFFLFSRRSWQKNEPFKRIIFVIAIFLLITILFFGFNYYLARYMLFAYPFFVVTGAYAVYNLLQKYRTRKYVIFLSVIYGMALVVVPLCSMDTGRFNDTYDMGYVHSVKCVQETVKWVEARPWKKERIFANFPVFQALEDKRNGYLSEQEIRFTTDLNDPVPYLIYFYLDQEQLPDFSRFEKIRQFDEGYAHILIMRNPAWK